MAGSVATAAAQRRTFLLQAQGPVCAQPARKATRGTERTPLDRAAVRPAALEVRVRIMEADMVGR